MADRLPRVPDPRPIFVPKPPDWFYRSPECSEPSSKGRGVQSHERPCCGHPNPPQLGRPMPPVPFELRYLGWGTPLGCCTIYGIDGEGHSYVIRRYRSWQGACPGQFEPYSGTSRGGTECGDAP